MTDRTMLARPACVALCPEAPARRAGQVLTDLLLLGWIGAWTWLAVLLYRWADGLPAADRLYNLQVAGHHLSEPLTRNLATLLVVLILIGPAALVALAWRGRP